MSLKNIKTAEELASEIAQELAVARAEQRKREKEEAAVSALEIIAKVAVLPVLDTLSENDFNAVSILFPDWAPGITWTQEQVTAVAVINFEGVLYKIVQPHTSQIGWRPDELPALYTPFRDPAIGPQPWVMPTGAQDAFAIGDRVTHDNPNDGGNIWIYESKIAANTTEPGRDGTFDRWWEPISKV